MWDVNVREGVCGVFEAWLLNRGFSSLSPRNPARHVLPHVAHTCSTAAHDAAMHSNDVHIAGSIRAW